MKSGRKFTPKRRMITKVRYFIHDVTNCKVCAKRVNPNGRGRRGKESNLESFRVDEIEGVGLHPLRSCI